MKYFSQDHQYINAECQNCGRVLKVPHRNCSAALGGLSITPAVSCKCGTTSDFINGVSLDYWMITRGTRIENDHHMLELIDLTDRLLPLYKWNFKLSAHYIYHSNKWDSVLNAQNYQGFGYPIVFYDSEKCRIRVHFDVAGRRDDHSITIHYGTLEVPDNANTVLPSVQEKDYHINWHSVRSPLYFLDGLSPQEARNAKEPQLIKEFKQSDIANDIRYAPEKNIILHATIWDTYGQSLFDIFDTRNKDLWEQYSAFVNKYWDWRTSLQPK